MRASGAHIDIRCATLACGAHGAHYAVLRAHWTPMLIHVWPYPMSLPCMPIAMPIKSEAVQASCDCATASCNLSLIGTSALCSMGPASAAHVPLAVHSGLLPAAESPGSEDESSMIAYILGEKEFPWGDGLDDCCGLDEMEPPQSPPRWCDTALYFERILLSLYWVALVSSSA